MIYQVHLFELSFKYSKLAEKSIEKPPLYVVPVYFDSSIYKNCVCSIILWDFFLEFCLLEHSTGIATKTKLYFFLQLLQFFMVKDR